MFVLSKKFQEVQVPKNHWFPLFNFFEEITLFFYKRPVYKRHEPEICRNLKKKIRECLGWDSALAIFENNFIQVSYLKNEF